ncbi:MAG: protease, partial [Actinomycetia bacterium]|nr:protease [Actinomycetes bacterium]
LRPLPSLRHRVPGLARALARHLPRARALARRLPRKIPLPHKAHLPRLAQLPQQIRNSPRDRIVILTVAAGCTLLGLVATAGDGGTLGDAAGFPARQLTTTPGTTPATPATARSGSAKPTTATRAPAPAPPASAWCQRSYRLACYSPRQIARAYDLAPLYAQGLDGRGRTIVIVDSFGSPTIQHDLRVFDSAFGLPGPPSLRVLRPVGKVPPYDPHNQDMVDAAGETTTDVEAAHAIAPGASILLVETPTAETLSGGGFPQFVAAENYVIAHHLGDVISQSFGIPEQNLPSRSALLALRSAYLSAHRQHVTVLAATNDFGVTGPTKAGGTFRTQRVVDWPASDPLVTAVGGTTLHLTQGGRRVSPDSAWNESGSAAVGRYAGALPWASSGGVSAIFGRPSYQAPVRAVVGDRRGIPDVALSASFSGASLTFESFTGAPGIWKPAAGTSVATPYFAGIVAIADQSMHTRLGLLNPLLYRLEQARAPGIVPVTKGGNTVSFRQGRKTITVGGYRAGPGYNLVTGVGTIDAARFIHDLRALRTPSCQPAGQDDGGRATCGT